MVAVRCELVVFGVPSKFSFDIYENDLLLCTRSETILSQVLANRRVNDEIALPKHFYPYFQRQEQIIENVVIKILQLDGEIGAFFPASNLIKVTILGVTNSNFQVGNPGVVAFVLEFV